MKEAILLTDGYKLDHRRQYPEGTEYVYSNWTPRSCHYYPEAKEGAVVFGIQYFFDWEKAEKIGIPLWIALIMLITCIIPLVNIVEVIVFWAIWLKYYSDPDGWYSSAWYTYWRFKDKFFSRKI